MKVRFIGDIHAYWNNYRDIIYRDMVSPDIENSIQVGDLGMGFNSPCDWAPDSAKVFHNRFSKGNHRFIRGNHDNPEEVKRSSHWIRDGVVEDTDLGNTVMYIGGAWSIDWQLRTMGVDWWVDEELSYQELNILIEVYKEAKPSVMVTHTAPISVPRDNMGFKIYGQGSRTEHALQEMLDTHRPKLWIFGHWHKSFDQVVDNTRFICLNEFEYIDLDI